MAFHQVVVDAYAAQHPATDGPQQVQSVGLHLMTLCLFMEGGVDPKLGTALHRKMLGRRAFRWLRRSGPGALTLLRLPAGAEVACPPTGNPERGFVDEPAVGRQSAAGPGSFDELSREPPHPP